jgi:hypothetical protein
MDTIGFLAHSDELSYASAGHEWPAQAGKLRDRSNHALCAALNAYWPS